MSAFNEAAKANDAAKAGALSALARGGSSAMAAYQRAQEQQAEMKRAATESALRRAAELNAGAAGQELLAAPGNAGAIYDRYSQDQGRAATARQQALADLSGANTNYFDQVAAARPIVEGRAKAAWDAKEAARLLAEQREREAQMDREMRLVLQQMQIEEQGMRMSAAEADRRATAQRAASGGDLSDSELRTRLTGAATMAQEDLARRRAAAKPVGRAMAGDVRMTDTLNDDPANAPLHELARRIGEAAGIDPMRVYGVVSAPDNKPIAPKQAAHRANVVARVQQYASPGTTTAFLAFVAGLPETEDTYAMPAVKSYAEAVQALKEESDADLRSHGISREVLRRWLAEYFSV